MRNRRRLYRDLHPLWLALVTAVPDICLRVPRRPERRRTMLPVISYRRLYRRVIEIHDGCRQLAEYAEPAVSPTIRQQAAAAGLTPAEAAATAKAAAIAVAIRNWRAGTPPARPGHPISASAVDVDVDVETDAAWLATVSTAFDRSPLVDAALRRPTERLDRS